MNEFYKDVFSLTHITDYGFLVVWEGAGGLVWLTNQMNQFYSESDSTNGRIGGKELYSQPWKLTGLMH